MGKIYVTLPREDEHMCGAEPRDNRNELACIVPDQNTDGWHGIFGGHLGQDAMGQYWTWPVGDEGVEAVFNPETGENEPYEPIAPSLRPDLVDPGDEE